LVTFFVSIIMRSVVSLFFLLIQFVSSMVITQGPFAQVFAHQQKLTEAKL
jgi:uncharacterized membrane protein